jgi:hypothetical protein
MVRQGRLRPIRICRRLLFAAADLERLIAGPDPPPNTIPDRTAGTSDRAATTLQ